MNTIKQHIAFRIFTVLLVGLLLLPASVKVAHIFQHHKHDVCMGEKSTHLHQIDLDCEFQKFQIHNHYTFSDTPFEIFSPSTTSEESISLYQFLSKFQTLHIALRGPPALV